MLSAGSAIYHQYIVSLFLTLYLNSWDLENSQVHESRVPNFIGHLKRISENFTFIIDLPDLDVSRK